MAAAAIVQVRRGRGGLRISRQSVSHFGDKDMRKQTNPERFPIGEAIPLRRETL